MGDTTANGLPYPIGTDRVMDGDDAIQALAEAVDAKALLTGDSGNLTAAAAGFTPAANFANVAGSARLRNGIASVYFTFTSSLALGGGNIGNVSCINIPPGWKPLIITGLSSGNYGPGVFYTAEPSGSKIALCATTAAGAVGAGATISVAGVWLV